VNPRCADARRDRGRDLVHDPIGGNAQVIFLALLAIAEHRHAFIAAAGINAIEHHHVSLGVPAAFSPIRNRLSYPQPGTNRRDSAMRFALILAIAMLLTPATLTARAASGLQAQAVTDMSAAKKQKKPKKAPKEEYLKAAPGTGPSGPKN